MSSTPGRVPASLSVAVVIVCRLMTSPWLAAILMTSASVSLGYSSHVDGDGHVDQLTSRSVLSSRVDYCDTESFRASCSSQDEVVMIERASYGRMRLGRCVETDMGHVGCQADVLRTADRRCSGRTSCEIRVPDAELEKSRPCLRELKTYLEITYSCLTVQTASVEFCEANKELPVSRDSPVGHLASVVTSDRPQCDGSRHPWLITGLHGQRINLTLYDFTIDTRRRASSSRKSSQSALCDEYATIEDSLLPGQHLVICGSSSRISHVYLSVGHVVKVWVTAGLAPRDLHRFVLHYRIIDCPDPTIPNTAWFQRTPDGHGVVGCRRRDVTHRDVTWRLECDSGLQWKHDVTELLQNCSSPSAHALESNDVRPQLSAAVDRLVLPSVVIAPVMICLIIVCVITAIIRLPRRRRRGHSSDVSMKTATVAGEVVSAPSSDDNERPVSVPALSSRVPIIAVDHWAVRPQPWLHANTDPGSKVTGSKVKRSARNAAAKPGRYTDVIGPFD